MITNGNAENLKCTKVYEEAYKREPDAVHPFFFYKEKDLKRIPEALKDGCNADAPGSFAAWLSKKTPMHAFVMPGKRYDIGDIASYENVKEIFENKQ